jgi:hypothetical protein
MARFLLYAVPVVVTLYALIDCVLIPGALTRALPKWVWLVVIVLIPFLGALAWLLAGRPVRDPSAAPGGPVARVLPRRSRGPVAPDDDPTFLRKLADDEWSRKMRDRRDRRDRREGPAAAEGRDPESAEDGH